MPLRLFTPGPVSSLATSPSGSYLAAAVQESITIWQLGTGLGFKINNLLTTRLVLCLATCAFQGHCWQCCPAITSL